MLNDARKITTSDPTQALGPLAERAARELEEASATEILRWAAGAFGPRLCVTSSMADAVLIHLASRVLPGVDVVFLDTGLHFAQTLALRDLVTRTMPVRVRSVLPALTLAAQADTYGPRLWERNPDLCCQLRKVEPLHAVLDGYDAWAAGLRRAESPFRADTPVVHLQRSRSHAKVKVNPIARWTDADVERYVSRHDVPANELRELGYASVGCRPCTRPGDSRAARWAGFDKTECGIHSA
jgi:phosphoadenosine phosphosulfate reductase